MAVHSNNYWLQQIAVSLGYSGTGGIHSDNYWLEQIAVLLGYSE